LGISGSEVIEHIRNLKSRKIVRQIGPIFDARKLGYQSTLVGIKIPVEMLPSAEKFIIEHPGISQGYSRDNEFNVWITLSLPRAIDMGTELERIARSTGAIAIFSLPALKVFKLRAYFGAEEDEPNVDGENTEVKIPSIEVDLSGKERWIINEIQKDLPLTASPFAEYANRLNIEISDLLSEIQSLKDRGIMRRFGAAINHRKAGYQANAMVCWKITPDQVDRLGQKLASLSAVSHCYERKTGESWKYNLFAMVHGFSREECQETVAKVAVETGLKDYLVLFSTQEFKKTRIKYQV
jgi:DNA-binding Lrp family transcriptional regulator